MRFGVSGLLAAALALSCGGQGDDPVDGPRRRGSAEVGGDVVSTVDGHPITRTDVEAAAREARVTPEIALERLEDELLLALAAERAGVAVDRPLERARRQAMVQALLARTVERAPVTVTSESVEVAYEANPERFVAPEGRRSVHVWASVATGADDAAQQQWIASVLAELLEAPDPVSAAFAIRNRALQDLPFEVMVQEVERMARDAPTDPAYVQALFEMESPGVVPTPVRTAMGWHVILLTRIEPERSTPRDEALATLRAEREAAQRYEVLAALTMELARASHVHLEPDAAALLQNPRVLGPDR